MILTTKKFSLFRDWNIDMILFSKELQSSYPLISLGKILTPRKEKVKANVIPKNRMIVSKIRFLDGHVFFKERVIKNDMNKSCIGDLLVSNINFEKGAFAINTWGDSYASTDYTSYIIDTSLIIPEYLFFTLRCQLFMNYVSSVKPKGMKTRARYDFIKNFVIPVPLKSVQEKILKTYYHMIEKSEENTKAGDDYGDGLLYDIQSIVSNLKNDDFKLKKSDSILQTIPFTSTHRWEVEYILKEGILESIYGSFKYPTFSIGELQTESLFGLSVKASLTQKDGMIPMLRMSNIIKGEIDYSGLKYLPKKCAVTEKEPAKYLLQSGDFLITRTNGSKDLVGKAAIFNNTETYTYASYLIRYRFDTTIVLPEYINIMFMTSIVREQIAVIRRQGGGQYNLNSDEINSIKIPVPSLQEQQAIIDKYNATKNGSNKFYIEAERLKKEADSTFEKTIFL
jgi:type I restriction enzyme S subunit